MDLVRTIKKGKSKSTKDKTRNIHLTPAISNPANATHITHIVTQSSDGLYNKLMQHKQSISLQISLITSALENGHIQYTSRHNKKDMTTVITLLLVQINSAITTTHQCVTRDIMDKNGSYRVRLEVNEKQIYENLAQLVRWVDFDSKTEKEKKEEEEREKLRILESIKRFQYALEEVVRLVYETQMAPGGGGVTPPIRRTSVDSGSMNSVQSDELTHPSLAQLRGGDSRDRKTSWSPAGSSSYREKTLSMSPSVASGDVFSEGSSTSDEEKRRSDSMERHPHSPDHLRGSVSPDWDSRSRSVTAPIDPASYSSSLATSLTYTSPGPHPVAQVSSDLPPLPGEYLDRTPPPPLPKKGGVDDHPPSVPQKGHTLPRSNLHVNGHGYGEGDEGEKPPPIPVKKKHSAMRSQVNGHGSPTARPADNGEVPPPLPLKQKQRRHGNTLGSPQHTPSHTHSLSTPAVMHGGGYYTADSLARSFGTSAYQRGSGSSDGYDMEQDRPPVPMRMESIPGMKSALVQDTPPPKPPRTDVVNTPVHVQASPQHPSMMPRASVAGRSAREEEVFNTIRKYNEDLIKARESGPDVAPPLPLKKKTVMIYKNLLAGYTYEESATQSLLIIPGMEAPPPIPPKKRKKRQAQTGGTATTPSGQPASNTSSLSRSEHSSSTDDMIEDTEETGEPNFYLECDDASGYLTFSQEDGGVSLQGGPVDALIAYAASSTKAVKHFSEAFLLTYSTFITPEELVTKLLYRLQFFYKSGTAAIWQATISLLVRALTGLNQVLAKDAQSKLINLVHLMISDGNLKFAQLLRNALVDKLNQELPDTKAQLTLGVTMRGSGKSTRKSLLEYPPDDLAKQMTILDNELFQKVDVCEMLYWAKEQNEEKSPMLTQFTMHFNNVSQWTKVQILRRGVDMKIRIKTILHFIAIMKCLRERYNNFNSYLAILSAIESSPISRLEWPDKVQKGLEAPRQLIDNRGSFKNYREAFAGAKPPCIPYIGLYLQDLTFIEMQPSKLDGNDTKINFTKRWKQFKSVDHIRFAQTKQYHYTPDPEILSLFWNFETDVTDEVLWSISHELKPSARAQRTQQQA